MSVVLSPEYLDHRRKLLALYILVRLAVACFFISSSLVFHLTETAHATLLVRSLLAILLLVCVQAIFSWLLLPRYAGYRQFEHAQIAWDLLLTTVIIYLTGCSDSLYSFLYILVIIGASVFLPRPQVLVVASASAILYGSLLDLQYYGFLPRFHGLNFPENLRISDIFYAVFLHVGAFLLTALLSGNLTERLRRSEQAREQREIDYGDLEQLNRSILANINSGLMIVSQDGRIRSFNQAAGKITGFALEEVYNRPIEIYFPAFSEVLGQEKDTMERGEATFVTKTRDELILGYSVSPVRDVNNNQLGRLIAFQDLTEYKSLEEQLKRADRLAAVGRLASGMAHEIRNPLASISGSVQLLMEDENVSDEDRRLMGIVVKEAERLSQLLSDFLDFAKPAPVQLEPVNLAALIDEQIALLDASGQFSGVSMTKDYAPSVVVRLDRQKMRQALWDLLLNAAEAALPSGQIKVTIRGDEGVIIIEDTGPGISEDIRDNIFEPFFTTKEKGTGLGLANVYANVEAHQGRIYVEPGEQGGARFIIELPEKCREIEKQENLDAE